MRKVVFFALAILVVVSCVRTKQIMLDPTAVKRPEVSPDSVRIIVDESELDGLEFERIAMIEATGPSGWTSQVGMLEAMRKKVGKLGGNAVLLPSINEASAGAKVAGAVFGTGTERKGNAIAIFIIGPKAKE